MDFILASFTREACIWTTPLLVCNCAEGLTALLVWSVACNLGTPLSLGLLFCLPISNASSKDTKAGCFSHFAILSFKDNGLSYFFPSVLGLSFIPPAFMAQLSIWFLFPACKPTLFVPFFTYAVLLCSSDTLFECYLGNSIWAILPIGSVDQHFKSKCTCLIKSKTYNIWIPCHHLPHLVIFLPSLSFSFHWKEVGKRVNKKNGRIPKFFLLLKSLILCFLPLLSSFFHKHTF